MTAAIMHRMIARGLARLLFPLLGAVTDADGDDVVGDAELVEVLLVFAAELEFAFDDETEEADEDDAAEDVLVEPVVVVLVETAVVDVDVVVMTVEDVPEVLERVLVKETVLELTDVVTSESRTNRPEKFIFEASVAAPHEMAMVPSCRCACVAGTSHVYDPEFGMFSAMVWRIVKSPSFPFLNVKVTVEPTMFPHLMVNGFPATSVSPDVGVEKALSVLAADTNEKRVVAATATNLEKSMLPM